MRLFSFAVLLAAISSLAGCAHTAPEPKTIRIALLSDSHVNNNGDTDGQNLFRPRFEKAIAMVNTSKVDLVVFTGDLTQDGKPDEFKDFQALRKQLNAPSFYVPGNHDVGNKVIPGKPGPGVTTNRVDNFEKAMGPSFFATTVAGVRLIGINSPMLGSGFERENEMWKFLEKELSKPETRPTIVFSHYPAFIKSADEGGGDYWNIEPEARKRLLDLLKKGNVKTMLSGHLHRDMVNRWDGIIFISTRPISFGLPKGKQPEGWTLVTLPPTGEAQYETFEIK
ncbi:MAG: calcineurin-like phosphoesterase superfamily domain protein [Verrucomicrobiales bacterium]|nr:calcineurin-like phosphoesterase superfamily domain protein [Verrucomicrobiales bacterium]